MSCEHGCCLCDKGVTVSVDSEKGELTISYQGNSLTIDNDGVKSKGFNSDNCSIDGNEMKISGTTYSSNQIKTTENFKIDIGKKLDVEVGNNIETDSGGEIHYKAYDFKSKHKGGGPEGGISGTGESSGGSIPETTLYSLTFNPIGNGYLYIMIDGYYEPIHDSPVNVSLGKRVTFTALPEDGYKVKEWKLNGEVVGDDSEEYIISSFQDNATVTVEFELE